MAISVVEQATVPLPSPPSSTSSTARRGSLSSTTKRLSATVYPQQQATEFQKESNNALEGHVTTITRDYASQQQQHTPSRPSPSRSFSSCQYKLTRSFVLDYSWYYCHPFNTLHCSQLGRSHQLSARAASLCVHLIKGTQAIPVDSQFTYNYFASVDFASFDYILNNTDDDRPFAVRHGHPRSLSSRSRTHARRRRQQHKS